MRIRYRVVALIALTSVAAACAPMDTDSLRSDPSRTKTFQSALDYKTVFDNEQRGFLACLTGNYYRFTFVIEPRIDRANKKASIVYRELGGIPAVWGLVDIRATAHGSEVTADAASSSLMRDFPAAVEQWAEGNPACPKYQPVLTDRYPISQ